MGRGAVSQPHFQHQRSDPALPLARRHVCSETYQQGVSATPDLRLHSSMGNGFNGGCPQPPISVRNSKFAVTLGGFPNFGHYLTELFRERFLVFHDLQRLTEREREFGGEVFPARLTPTLFL